MHRRQLAIPLVLALFVQAAGASAQVAALKTATGHVEVSGGGDKAWEAAAPGRSLASSEMVRTGKDSLARIELLDGNDQQESTRIDLVPETEVRIGDLVITRDQPPKRSGLLSLITGGIRSFAKGWGAGSVFSVESEGVVSGIRGSEVYQEPNVLVMLSGKVFKFHARDSTQARKVLDRLAARADEPGQLGGVELLPLRPGYVGTYEKDARGRIVSREITLPPAALRKLQKAFADLSKAISRGGRFEVQGLLAPLKEQLASAKAEAAKAPPKIVNTARARIEELLENLRGDRGGDPGKGPADVAPDLFKLLEQKTDTLETTLNKLEGSMEKAPVLEDLETMLDDLDELEEMIDQEP